VNVRSEDEEGIYRVAMLISQPVVSKENGDVGYVVDFETNDAVAQVPILPISDKKFSDNQKFQEFEIS
jgi:hypothetical protein